MPLHRPRYALLFAAALALAGTARPLRAQDSTGTLAGRVTADAGGPLGGATIFVVGTQRGGLTRNDGSYRVQLPAGRYVVRARLIGYAARVDTVDVAAGETATRDFVLARSTTQLSAVAIVGSRGEARTVIDAPAPIDVLSAAEIRTTGRTETAQILQALAPSVNFPRATISDGTDHVRPATLRGLAPDQVLVLVNGKRRHTSALVNVNGAVGRGSTAVDLNAIPASMIDRVEVLREGAAAQYGSDAIAGVVNIILKSTSPGEAAATLGRTNTTYGREFGQDRKATDGAVVQLGLNGGVARSATNYLHGGVELRDRGYTNRSLGDPRPQNFQDVTAGVVRSNADGPITFRQGDAATNDVVGFLNGSFTLPSAIELYGFGGLGHREGESAGNWRQGQNNNTIRSLYPNGFLPFITSDIWDASGVVGARGTFAGFRTDLSTTFGGNSFRFGVKNSNNASLGNASPTSFYIGTLIDRQSTTNLDVAREYRLTPSLPLRAAAGAEFRYDSYQIKEGEPDSWRDGGVTVIDRNGNPTTTRAAPGAQVFPGFRPTDAVDANRNNYSLYVDLETDITPALLVGVAGRFEDYSDFGTTTNYKVASRLTVAPGYVVRGGVSTGFRAPSLQQSFFSSTQTNFINVGGNLTPFEVKTFPVATEQARLLGARPLEPERSVNSSVGIALEPLRSLALTVDGYQIDVSDRIVLSENFTGAAVAALLQPLGATGGRYFTNAIDTRTRGVDVVANYGLATGPAGFVRLTGGFNRNYTRVTHVDSTPTALGNQSEALFGRVERARIEEGQPRTNILAAANYDYRRFGLVARSQRYGEVTTRTALTAAGIPSAPDQTFGAKWISDVSASYRPTDRLTLTVGSDNVFDVYPDENSDRARFAVTPSPTASGNATFGILPYNQFSPFGFNGRFIYTRLAFGL